MEGTNDRRKRIRRLKKIIISALVIAVTLPIIISVFLGIRVISLQKQVKELEEAIVRVQTEAGEESGIFTTASIETSKRNDVETVSLEQEVEEQDGDDMQKKVYLTFDDGPSRNTNRILDVLKEYDVKATFFVVGKTDEESVKAYQRIVAEGHTLAMHSYSHKYADIYQSKDSFMEDISRLQEYLYEVTGVWSRFYRFPGGSSNSVSTVNIHELIAFLNENNITYFDWNIASGDAVTGHLDAETIKNNCISKIGGLDECMILMHDATDKSSTVEALPSIISELQGREDIVFLPVTDETVPVQHVTAK